MFPENRFMELLIIGALALIVIGPKDLPILMRRIGQFMGRIRGMAAEFRASFDELARQSELDELRREVEALRKDTSLTPDASPGAPVGEAKNALSLHMTPAMTPLPQPEAPVADAGPPAPPEEASPPSAVDDPPQKPKRAPRKKASAGASGTAA